MCFKAFCKHIHSQLHTNSSKTFKNSNWKWGRGPMKTCRVRHHLSNVTWKILTTYFSENVIYLKEKKMENLHKKIRKRLRCTHKLFTFIPISYIHNKNNNTNKKSSTKSWFCWNKIISLLALHLKSINISFCAKRIATEM